MSCCGRGSKPRQGWGNMFVGVGRLNRWGQQLFNGALLPTCSSSAPPSPPPSLLVLEQTGNMRGDVTEHAQFKRSAKNLNSQTLNSAVQDNKLTGLSSGHVGEDLEGLGLHAGAVAPPVAQLWVRLCTLDGPVDGRGVVYKMLFNWDRTVTKPPIPNRVNTNTLELKLHGLWATFRDF